MKLKGIWILCAIALGGLALAVAGCGGDGGSTTTVTVETSAAETTDTTATETDMTATETDMTATDTETSGTETTALPSFATSENCQAFVALAGSFAAALSGTGDADTEEAAQAMKDFADQAPEEIRDDFQTLADAYGKIAEALQGVDLSSGQAPPADVMAKLAEISSEIDTAAVTAASANISAWTTENCTNG